MENIASFPAGKMRKGAGKRSRSLSASGRLCHAQFYAAALVRLHDHGVALVELAVDDQRRERFLDVVHQRPLERTHAVARLVAHGRQPAFGPFGDLHLVAQPARAGHQPLQFQVDDPFHVGDLQRAEQHDVVDAVEELRGEGVLQSLAVLALGRPVSILCPYA